MHLLSKKPCKSIIIIILSVPSTSHSTRTAAWFGFDIGSSTDQRNVRMTTDAENVQYLEQKGDHIFSRQCISKSSNSNIDIVGYIDPI